MSVKKQPSKLALALTRFWVGAVKTLRFVPMPLRKAMAAVLALVLWVAIPQRRHVALTNLRLCFPHRSEKERVWMAKRCYRRMARAALDHGVLWAGSREAVAKLVRFEGVERLEQAARDKQPVILIAPHFLGLDAAGIGLNLHVRGCSLYQRQSNPVWDEATTAGRMRFAAPELVAKCGRGQDLKRIIRLMHEGLPFYYLPDMDHGRKNSIWVPFFGVPAATVPMVSRLAQVTRAKVLFSVPEMTHDGYLVHLSEFWENFPTQDAEADTRRITQELEKWILRFPDQYLWTHRRFKTRPLGEPSLY